MDVPGTGGRHAELDALLAAVAPLMESLDESMAGAQNEYGQIRAQVEDGNEQRDERAADKFYIPAYQRLQSLIFGDGTRQSPGIFAGLVRAADKLAAEAEADADRYARYLPDDLGAARAAHEAAKETAGQAEAQLVALIRYAQVRELYADLAGRVGPLEQAAREEAEKARTEAQQQQGTVLALAEAEKLIPQAIQTARERLAAADTSFESGDYPQAAAAYGEVAGLWQMAESRYGEVAATRYEAQQMRTAAVEARKNAEAMGGGSNYPDEWEKARRHFEAGESEMSAGNFKKARGNFNLARENYLIIVDAFPLLRADLEEERVEALAQRGKLTASIRSQSAEDVQAGEQAIAEADRLRAQGARHVRAALEQYRAAIAHFQAAQDHAHAKVEALRVQEEARRAERGAARQESLEAVAQSALGNQQQRATAPPEALGPLEPPAGSQPSATAEQTPAAGSDTPPVVSPLTITIFSPEKDGMTIIAETQEFTGVVRDPEGNLDRVECRVNEGDWQSAACTAEKWRFTATLVPGENTVDVRAADKTGLLSPLVSRRVVYQAPNAVPVLTVTNPATDSLELSAETTILIQGTASDPEGQLGAIYYEVGIGGPPVSVPIAEPTWQFSFEATNGTHQLRVWAVDHDGAKSDMAERTIVVREPLQPSDPPDAG